MSSRKLKRLYNKFGRQILYGNRELVEYPKGIAAVIISKHRTRENAKAACRGDAEGHIVVKDGNMYVRLQQLGPISKMMV